MLYNSDDFMFNILTIDRFFHKEGVFDVKARPYAALSFREQGTGTFKISGKIFHTEPGDVLFIPADTPYEVEYSPSKSIVVNMESCAYSSPELFNLHSEGGVALMFALLLDEWDKFPSANRAKATIYSILEKIGEYCSEDAENPALRKCIQYIDANFADSELDIKKVCDVAFLSRSNLYRLFIRRFGMSPKQYIIKQRLNKALKLLVSAELSVKEISTICGFSDDKYFSRIFKEKYGYPPSKLRRNAHM